MTSSISTILLVSVFIHFVWVRLDANPTLYLHDIFLTTFRLSSLSDSNLMKNISSPTERSSMRRRILGGSKLEGKTVWITGASSGIGADLSVELALSGVSRIVLSALQKERLEEVAEACRRASEARRNAQGDNKPTSKPFEAIVVPFNLVGGKNAIERAVSDTLAAVGPSGIDILILNAGKYQLSPALETDVEKVLPSLMDLNFESAVQLSSELIKADQWKSQKDKRRRHIVVTSSIQSRGPNGLSAIYVASKHAIRAYFQTLAAEENSWLRVDVVCPGATATGFWSSTAKEKAHAVQPYTNEEVKMDARRCAQLIVSGMVGPAFLFHETWITKNPGLIWVFFSTYAPTIFRPVNDLIARLRVDIWRKDGSDPLYIPVLIRHLLGK